MNNVNKDILEFIDYSFSLYNINIRRAITYFEECYGINFDGDEYFTYEDDRYWAIEHYPAIVDVAALVFGTSVEDIVSCNEEAVERFYKDSYIEFFEAPSIISECIRGGYFSSDIENKGIGRLLGVLTSKMSLNESLNYGVPSRYDYGSIRERLLDKLREDDSKFPGIYHHGKSINYLEVDTGHFISYASVGKYITDFIKIAGRIEELFYRILEGIITDEEVKEYNFYILALDVRLVVCSGKGAFYENVVRFKEFYRKAKYNEITSYIRFDFWKIPNFQPWRCIEFTNDYSLAQLFFKFIPEAKPAMRQFAMNIKYYECVYSWTDSPRIIFPNEEEEKRECEMMGMKYIPPEERPQVKENIYLEKNKDELGKDAEYASALMKMAAPSKLGGIYIYEPEGRVFVRDNPTKALISAFGL